MIIYHGSPKIVEVPTFGLGSPHNDYGQGFYCTEKSELAKEWACPTINDGFSNKYELDLSDLNVLYLNKNGYNILNWIAILLKNRTFTKRSPVSREASKYIMSEFMPDISGYVSAACADIIKAQSQTAITPLQSAAAAIVSAACAEIIMAQ